jgi:hypothetical protein
MSLATKVDFDHTAFSPPTGGVMAKQQNDGGSPTVKMGFGVDKMAGDSGSGGTPGVVPAPASGDAAAGKYLKADGTWDVPAGGGGGATLPPLAFQAMFPGVPAASAEVDLGTYVGGTFPADFVDSPEVATSVLVYIGTNPTATATFNIYIDSTLIGTVAISTSGVATFATTSHATQAFAINKRFRCVAPATPDATMANVLLIFRASR